MAIVKILQRGQMTLPKAIREHVDLEEGDDVLVYVNGEGELVLYPLPRPRSLKEPGSVLNIGRPVDKERARKAIHVNRVRRWAEKHGLQGRGKQVLAQVAAGRETAETGVREVAGGYMAACSDRFRRAFFDAFSHGLTAPM